MNRISNRPFDQIRSINIQKNFTKYAEGSVFISLGETKVICNASVVKGIPSFLINKNQGWLTAEYSMLPRATYIRTQRESINGKQSGRTQEIQRFIGRVLRASINLHQFPEYTIKIDCDVIQADGGTRTASIIAASLALRDALNYMSIKKIAITPTLSFKKIAAISVGIYNGHIILDLDYNEDSNSSLDMNLVMTEDGHIIEIQTSSAGCQFTESQLNKILSLSKKGITHIFNYIKTM